MGSGEEGRQIVCRREREGISLNFEEFENR